MPRWPENGQKSVEEIHIVDNSGDRKYFTVVPNFILDTADVWDILLYINIKRIAGESGTCWKSLVSLSKQCKMSVSRTQDSLKHLVDSGLIKQIGKKPVLTPGGIQYVNEYIVVDIWTKNAEHYKGMVSENIPLTSTDKGMVPENIPLSKGMVPENNPDLRYGPDNGKVWSVGPSNKNPVNKNLYGELDCVDSKNSINQILEFYSKNIQSLRTKKSGKGFAISGTVQRMLKDRLEIYSIQEIIDAITSFSKDEWWKDKRHLGLKWFLNVDNLDRFLNMKQPVVDKIDPTIRKMWRRTGDPRANDLSVDLESPDIQKKEFDRLVQLTKSFGK